MGRINELWLDALDRREIMRRSGSEAVMVYIIR